MTTRPSFGVWKLRQIVAENGYLTWQITRNGIDQLEEPMTFKGQAVRLKTQMWKSEAHAVHMHARERNARLGNIIRASNSQ